MIFQSPFEALKNYLYDLLQVITSSLSNSPEEGMAQLVTRDEADRLGHGVERDFLLVLETLLPHLHREVLVVNVAGSLRAVVREHQQNILRENIALFSRCNTVVTSSQRTRNKQNK